MHFVVVSKRGHMFRYKQYKHTVREYSISRLQRQENVFLNGCRYNRGLQCYG